MNAPRLDQNERAMLAAIAAIDDGEHWLTGYASGLAPRDHGGDLAMKVLEGRVAVMRRLAQRKLLDAEPGARGIHRGYSINDAGRAALAAATS